MSKKYIAYFIPILLVLSLALGMMIEIGTSISPKSDVKNNTIISSEVRNEDLYKKIEAYSRQHILPPIDAKIDPVWKAIPGYNGIGVNIDASYMNMKTDQRFEENKIVYQELAPAVRLDDLDPQPIYRGNPEKPMVVFLINVAWGNEFIPDILETLHNNQIKTTFFFDGSWVEKNPEIAKIIYEAGHEIGNHAYTHPDLEFCSRDKAMEELKKTNDVIEETLGIKPIWFAPPSGSFSEETVQVAHELGMKTILWTVDTIDWRKPATSEMVNRVVSKIENGSMVLMHPTKPTAEGLETMIKHIKGMGYKLGTVSDLMSERRIESKY